MRSVLGLFLTAVWVLAQQDPEKIRAAMQASLDSQAASVLKQATGATPVARHGFYTVPWPEPPVVAQAVTIGDCAAMSTEDLDPLIREAAATQELKPALLRAVIRKESAGRPCAVSVKGAQGLMQIMPATAQELDVGDPFDPKQNIDAGAKFLKQLITKYSGDLALALAAYNAGPARVDREGKIPQIPETQDYVRSILGDLKIE